MRLEPRRARRPVKTGPCLPPGSLRWVERYGPRLRVLVGTALLVYSAAFGVSVTDPFGCRAAGACYPALHAVAAFPPGTGLLFLLDPLLPRRVSHAVWALWALGLAGLLVWLRASAPG